MSSALLWELKQEPESPLSEESLVSDDAALYLEQYPKADVEFLCESKAEVASKLLEGLEQLEDLDEFIKEEDLDQWIKDEPFSTWLEEKMLPIFGDVNEIRGAAVPAKVPQQAVPDTQSLLQEFETVFDAVEMTHGTLTPPQSPPYQPLLATLEPMPAQPLYYPEKPFPDAQKALPNIYDYAQQRIEYPQPDVARELAVVDEIIRSRAEDMIQCPSSPCSNSSSGSSNFGDCSSDDPEWIPEPVDAESLEPTGKGAGRKRFKPYSRAPPEDKKSRKKEQNKNAATRYRMKKKAEVEEILEEERGLCKTNEGLETKITDLQREVKYLKGLMRDLFKAKGLIN